MLRYSACVQKPASRARKPGNTTVLDSYGGVTAALKRAIEVQQLAQDRSFGVAVDSYSTWQATRLLGTNYGCG